jgi:putative sterol carrier protein
MPRAGWSDSDGIVNRPSTSEARVTRRMSRGPGEPQSRLARLFYMHVGSFVALPVYAIILARAAHSVAGLRHALLGALVVETAYVALAARRREIKYADYCLWTVFALGTLLVFAGVDSAVFLFQNYAPAIFFGTLGLMALVPLLLGRETFTYYYARRQTPRWQQNLPAFHSINRLMAAFWTLIFFAAALLAASAPHDWRFTALYPNLLVFAVGVPAPFWLTPLFLRLFPPALPQTVEPLIMGMPYVFNSDAAGDADARIQFCVSGPDAGDYHLRIANGKCESLEGRTRLPDLTVYTPDTVWVKIVHGHLDRARALEEGLYRVEGDLTILAQMAKWFPSQATRHAAAPTRS